MPWWRKGFERKRRLGRLPCRPLAVPPAGAPPVPTNPWMSRNDAVGLDVALFSLMISDPFVAVALDMLS